MSYFIIEPKDLAVTSYLNFETAVFQALLSSCHAPSIPAFRSSQACPPAVLNSENLPSAAAYFVRRTSICS